MASAEESGTFRVVFDNAAESNARKGIDFATVIHSGAAKAAPTGATLDSIPRTGHFRQAGRRIVYYFISDATDTVESEESQAEIPVILRDAVTHAIVSRKTLTFESATSFTSGGTVDVVCTAAIPARIAYEDAPNGTYFQLDPLGKVRVYFGDDTA